MEDYVLPDAPECPWCALEAEVVEYYREVATKKRVGYLCTAGAIVHYGQLIRIGVSL
jgi:hypothetical protein